MCFSSASTPRPVIVDPANRGANAAADAVVARRKDAQGFSATLGNGAPIAVPSLGRQMLLGGA
jgi:hypothetical protein